MAALILLRQDGRRQRFALSEQPLRIGRAEDADIRLDEPLVSRVHARIERRGEEWMLEDLDSRNFTRVNGERIQERPLNHGDEILFARTRCLFLAEDSDEDDGAPLDVKGNDGPTSDSQ